jgi:hypothetical protein
MISFGFVCCGKFIFSPHMVNDVPNLPNFNRPNLDFLLKKHGKGKGANLLWLKGSRT